MALSACSTSPVKTETVTVYVSKTVQVPRELTAHDAIPEAVIEVNSNLTDYILVLKAALYKAYLQLDFIGELK